MMNWFINTIAEHKVQKNIEDRYKRNEKLFWLSYYQIDAIMGNNDMISINIEKYSTHHNFKYNFPYTYSECCDFIVGAYIRGIV